MTVTSDLAIEAARKAEKAILAGEDHRLLTGLPLSIKDLTASRTFASRPAHERLLIRCAAELARFERVKAHGAAITATPATTEFGCRARRRPANRRDAQSVEPRQNDGRLLGRRGRKRRRWAYTIRARYRQRQIDPHSIVILRTSRHQGTVWPRTGVPGRGRADARTCWTYGPHRARHRAATDGDFGFDARDPASVAAEVPDYLGACERSPKGLRITLSPSLGSSPDARGRVNRSNAARALEAFNATSNSSTRYSYDPMCGLRNSMLASAHD